MGILSCGQDGSTTEEVFERINEYDGVDSATDLLSVDFSKTISVNLKGYYTPSDGGGGLFNYDSTVDKSTANGGMIIDPSQTLANQGNGVGLGCWVRQYSEKVNVKWFGAKGDGTTDDSPSVQTAIDIYNDIFFPKGTYIIGATIHFSDGMNISGIGHDSIIKRKQDATDELVFLKSDPLPIYSNISFKDIAIEGTWDTQRRETTGSLINARNISTLSAINVKFMNSCGFGLNINVCEKVIVDNCRFEKIARDMCGVWSADEAIITNNIFKHNDDDCISVNSESFDGLTGNKKTRIIISDNTLTDTGGIRAMVAHTVAVTGNIIDRAKGSSSAIFVSSRTTSGNKNSNYDSVLVSDNIITNKIDRTLSLETISESQNNRVAIFIDSVKPIVGTLAVPPREINNTTGQAESPYSYINTDSGVSNTSPIGVGDVIIISNNIVKRTLPTVSVYSDWNYGEMFTRHSTDVFAPTGWVDPVISDNSVKIVPIKTVGYIQNALVTNNIFKGSGDLSIWFTVDATTPLVANMLRNFRITNNIIHDCVVGIDISQFNTTYQDIHIENNDINCDPYIISSERSVTYKGAWDTGAVCKGIDYTGVKGVHIISNSFRNAKATAIGGSAAAYCKILNNAIHAKPIADGYDVQNRGIGQLPWDMTDQFYLVYEECDPTQTNYGEILDYSLSTLLSDPVAGFYVKNTFVKNNGGVVVTKNTLNQTIFGYVRLTTGDTHVIGTDWRVLYAEV